MKVSLFGKEVFSVESRSATDVSVLTYPQQWLVNLLGNINSSGINVNETNALTLPVYYSALKILGEDIAKLPGGVFKKTESGRTQIKHPVSRLLFKKPNPLMNSFHWRVASMVQANSFGNSYSLIQRNGDAAPTELKFIKNPKTVTIHVVENELWYKVSGMASLVRARDMHHIHGIGYDGVQGYPILQAAKEILGGGLASQRYSNKNFENGGLKHLAITVPKASAGKGVNSDTEDIIKKKWKTDRENGDISILPMDQDVREIGLNPAEIEQIKTQEFTVEQFSRFTRIPLHMLNHLSKATFSNIEQQSKDYITNCLLPWITQFELEAWDKLFTETEQGNLYTKFNVSGLLRGDSAARGEFYSKGIQNGFFSPNEVRGWEELNPRNGGDDYLTPVNMNTDEMVRLIVKGMKEESKKQGNE